MVTCMAFKWFRVAVVLRQPATWLGPGSCFMMSPVCTYSSQARIIHNQASREHEIDFKTHTQHTRTVREGGRESERAQERCKGSSAGSRITSSVYDL
jgi:hypothetical protein